MVRFSTAPVEEVVPKSKQRQPSQRAQIQEQYQDALRDAVIEHHSALVVELEPDDKPLTIRNRIKRAADVLGYENIVIRRRGERMVAYLSEETIH
ncbi:MAG: hypothetical protein NVS2B16_01800 [Chloroflexota bacterium]